MLPVFPFKYPARWGFSPPEFKGIPFDIRPMERKELYWSNQRFNLMVWWPQEMTPLFLALQSQPGNLFLEGPRFLAFEAKAPLAQLELADWRDLFLCHAFAEIKETPRPKPEQARFLGILKTDARLQSRCDALPRPLALALQPAAETNPNRTHLNLSHDQPIQLLRLETYHPDWRAKLDGASLVGIRLNPPFSLYQIPAGPHQLDFSFVSLYAFVVWLHLAAWLGVTLGLPLWLTQNPVPSLAPPPRGA
ncbi:MAG: hypothetical protein A2527_12880 [Candidatus Lambdaproteobacteria bacterium RIFOXYD2_FULL_50_16]|uniref:Uncharacterized protein n=1 Tax=Candidatus Lambdaproteobacteria bacterium RIFOXYD2_FULL_50_16 TaxID=1817772 RepID=A0A1F6G9Q8_9PROT|nr:MAG: hypothetical protein A2527_12880 [Candidatus Lambdaproteobacteria bacterium RIFOXYD2_FULL_50_16]